MSCMIRLPLYCRHGIGKAALLLKCIDGKMLQMPFSLVTKPNPPIKCWLRHFKMLSNEGALNTRTELPINKLMQSLDLS